MTSFNFTKSALDNLPLSGGGEIRYFDTKVPYLIIAIGKRGKSFKLYKKINGRVRTVKLGDYPEYSIAEMREKAQKTFISIKEGKELNAKEETIYSFIDKYFAYITTRFEAGSIKKSSFESIERHLNIKKITYPKLPSILLKDFNHGEANKYLELIETKHSAVVRDKMLTTLKAMFNNALSKGLVTTNPFLNINKKANEVRERYLTTDEVRALIEASKEEDLIYQHALLVLLLTGQRKDNVLNMKWKDINFQDRIWSINSTESKNKKMMKTPLSEQLMDVLQLRYKLNINNHPYVFPSKRLINRPISEKTSKGSWWYRIRKRADLHFPDDSYSNVCMHDLRRTNASIQLQLGAPISTVSKTMHHASMEITAKVYAITNMDQQRSSLQNAADLMTESTSQEPIDIDSMSDSEKDTLLRKLLNASKP